MLGTEGCLSRPEIAERLARLGIPSAGQATVHVIWRAALDGLVCYGPDRNGEATFVLLDEWVPPARQRDRDDALAELARRLQAYGPAQPADLAAWSGLSLADARRASDISSRNPVSRPWLLGVFSCLLRTGSRVVRVLPPSTGCGSAIVTATSCCQPSTAPASTRAEVSFVPASCSITRPLGRVVTTREHGRRFVSAPMR